MGPQVQGDPGELATHRVPDRRDGPGELAHYTQMGLVRNVVKGNPNGAGWCILRWLGGQRAAHCLKKLLRTERLGQICIHSWACAGFHARRA